VDVVKSAVEEATELIVAAGEAGDFCATEKPARKGSNILALKTKEDVAISV